MNRVYAIFAVTLLPVSSHDDALKLNQIFGCPKSPKNKLSFISNYINRVYIICVIVYHSHDYSLLS